MDRRQFLLTTGVGVSALSGCLRNGTKDGPPSQFSVGNQRFSVRDENGRRELFISGVNLGMGKPGAFPGEAAITRAEYDRWIEQIAEMSANAIRVYTVHPPAFYEALAAYNRTAADPVYIFHGNWLPARLIEGDTTAFDTELTDHFDDSLQTVIDVVHGNAELPERRGYASGTYETDVSDYTIGYIAGVEWEPRFVRRTNERHDGGKSNGEYVRSTTDAAAFERWVAHRLDTAAAYEVNTYDQSRPLSVSNWPTTDHLEHPSEPLHWEDTASVNPNNIATTDAFEPGTFATYHAYPYYPDFQNVGERYTEYTDSDGEKNSYAAYLNELVAAVDGSVLIGEFGVPASRGIAHEHVHGMDQGHHTETEQGRHDAELFETIAEADTAGGLVFAWQDEWFKRTWNTMQYTNPNRRPEWLNVQSPEERFGLLSFDPADGVTLSGDDSEWESATRVATDESGEPQVGLEDGADGARSLRALDVATDAAYLSIRLQFDRIPDRNVWDDMHTLLAIDTTPDGGNTELPRGLQTRVSAGADFVVELMGTETSRIRVASHYDQFYYEYGEQGGYLDAAPYAATPDNGVYHPIRLALSYPLTVPTQDRTIPFQATETGALRHGTADPAAENYDSLADFRLDVDSDTLEFRLSWQLLNFRDPSSGEIMGDFWDDGLDASREIETVGLIAATYAPTVEGQARELSTSRNTTDQLPKPPDDSGSGTAVARFELPSWNDPEYVERRKESYSTLKRVYERY